MFAFNPLPIAHLQVRQLSFVIIHSTTIALPAWCCTCTELGLKERLIPCDILTWWNLTYDMLRFVLAYKKAIDQATADKALKLRKYELNNDDWAIVEDLVSILEVHSLHFINYIHYWHISIYRPTKRQLFSSLKMEQAFQQLSLLWADRTIISTLIWRSCTIPQFELQWSLHVRRSTNIIQSQIFHLCTE